MRKRIFSLLTALALCLSLLPATASAADHGDHSADDGWTALSGEQENLTLSNKSYYLSDDVTYTGTGSIGVTGTVTLCLNGHVLDLSGQYIRVEGDLTLCDCSTGVTTQGTSTAAACGQSLTVPETVTSPAASSPAGMVRISPAAGCM